jgi:signal transduction histidine kinase
MQSLVFSRVGFDLDHMVVRVGAAAALFAGVLYLVIAAATGEATYLISACGPFLAAGVMITQILTERENGGIALLASGAIVVIFFSFDGNQTTMIPAAVALVIIASIGMMFVEENLVPVASVTGIALFSVTQLWPISLVEKVILGSIMTLSFAMTFLILVSIYRSVTSVNARYQLLFDQSPTAVVEENWSEALAHVRDEYSGKPEKLEHFLESYPDVVSTAVSKARVVQANDAALRLLEVPDAESLSRMRRPGDYTDGNLDGFVQTLSNLYRGHTTWEQEVLTRSSSGQLLWLHARYVDTAPETPGASLVSGITDITSIKARNEAMEEMVRQKNEFIARVSHELRTPLTAVMGLSNELVESASVGHDERHDLIKVVAQQAGEMSDIVEDLLMAARADMGTITIDLQPVDLLEELRSTMKVLGTLVELPQTEPPKVLADPKRVRQILRNLLTNAGRYGGPNCRVLAGSLFSTAWMEIRDDGEGVTMDPSRVFEPFVTGQHDVPGSVGLGLSVARQLAEVMGGSLSYLRQGHETVFRLELPVVQRPQPTLASSTEAR